jgi:type I restriction enzyme S subunit
MRARKSVALAEYVEILLNEPGKLEEIDGLKTGISESGVNLTQTRFLGLLVQIPTLIEQTEIVRRVKALFALADRLEARAQAALARYSRLTPALLAKAFRGELVPQDPADEPASVLLERIRAQREAEGPVKKAGGRGRKPAATPTLEDGAWAGELQSETKRGRGRPRKVAAEAEQATTPEPLANSYEDAVRLLEARKLERATGNRQAALFGAEE